MRFIPLITLCVSVLFLASCNTKTKVLEEQVAMLKDQLEHHQSTNTNLLDRMAELSVINQSDAVSIKQSLEMLNRQNDYITDLSTRITQKDSINLALVTNLKRSLIDIDDQDIAVEIKGSAVFVSIADKLLFSTGSTRVSAKAKEVLGKVAAIINDHADLDVMVKGHTDIVPIKNDRLTDNWDLSVLRATSVIRILQDDFYVDPTRLTAAGRSMYEPKIPRDDAAALSANRRTEVILTPGLAKFFNLLELPAIQD